MLNRAFPVAERRVGSSYVVVRHVFPRRPLLQLGQQRARRHGPRPRFDPRHRHQRPNAVRRPLAGRTAHGASFFKRALQRQHPGQLELGREKARLHLQGQPVVGDRFVEATRERVCPPQVGRHDWEQRIERERPLHLRDALVRPTHRHQIESVPVMARCEVGLRRDRPQ